jgi:hypothetical protein
LLTLLYGSVPAAWLWLLKRHQHELNPEVSSRDERLALFIRDNHLAELSYIRFLFDDYKCNKWWFEVAELCRRIIFISILPLLAAGQDKRAALGCIMAQVSLIYIREEVPFKHKFTNFIAYVAQCVIFLTYFVALTIETGVEIDFGLGEVGVGVFLVLTNVSIVCLAALLGFRRYRRVLRKQTEKNAKVNKIKTKSKSKSNMRCIRVTFSLVFTLVFHLFQHDRRLSLFLFFLLSVTNTLTHFLSLSLVTHISSPQNKGN